MQEMRVQSLGQEDSLEEETATHSSTLAWRIPWTEGPGGLRSTGSQGQTSLSTRTYTPQPGDTGDKRASFILQATPVEDVVSMAAAVTNLR